MRFGKTFIFTLSIALGAACAFGAVKPEDTEKPKNPLRSVAQQMSAVGRRIDRGDLAIETTQKDQDRIIKRLDTLIEASKPPSGGGKSDQQKQPKPEPSEQKQKPQSSPKNTSANPRTTQQKQPATASKDVRGGGKAQPGPEVPGVGEWGNLPPRTRSELFQALKEDFPEDYKTLLKLYYKHLSEREE